MKPLQKAVSTIIILLCLISSGCFINRKKIDDLNLSFGCRYRCEGLNGFIGPTIELHSYRNKTKLMFNSQDGKHLSSIVVRFTQVPNCFVELYPNYSNSPPLELPDNKRGKYFSKLNDYKITRQTFRLGDDIIDCISDYYKPTEGEESLSMNIYKYLNKPLKDFLLYLDADSSSIALLRFGGNMFINEIMYKSKKENITVFISFWHDGNQSIYKKLSEPTAGLSDIENYPISRISYFKNENINIECISQLLLGNSSVEDCFSK